MKLNWNFQRGGGVLEKIPSVGEVGRFSGITQWHFLGLSWKKATGPGKFWKSVKLNQKYEMYRRQ